MRWFLQEAIFWGLTVAPWLNIFLVARLAWRGHVLWAVLLIPLVGIGGWLFYDILRLVFGTAFFSPPWAVFGWVVQSLWAMGIALCAVLFIIYLRRKERGLD
jgi:hypothetical protein